MDLDIKFLTLLFFGIIFCIIFVYYNRKDN